MSVYSVTSSVVAQPFITLIGEIALPQTVLREITRPFANGVAWQNVARRAEPFTLRGIVDATNAGTANAGLILLNNSVGYICTIVRDNVTYSNALMVACREVATEPVIAVIGGVTGANSTRIVTVDMTFQYAGL